MIRNTLIFIALILLGLGNSCSQPEQTVSLKNESLKTMLVLTETLLQLQVTDSQQADFGALECERCNVLHTRAAEAVYPFAVAFKHTGNEKYVKAAIQSGNWLIRQQLAAGEWQETPEFWTGTTTDQLLMLGLAFEIVKNKLSPTEQEVWMIAMQKAADYLIEVMNPEFASINYCATTTATLAMMHHFFSNEKWAQKARELAWQVAAKMDEDGFIAAEGDRVYGEKYGADVGYEIDMSLWGLGLYARLMGDAAIYEIVNHSLENHLTFVYPNGSIDGSWGIRSNKWTTFGSSTADGCQFLFSLFAPEDDRYRSAALRNLEYLRTMIHNGMIGYGPHYFDIFETPPCNYPTFARAKNLALTVELGEQRPGITPPLPVDAGNWLRLFPTVDVAQVRTQNLMATISAYRYKELRKRNKSKYMHRPAGGSICNLWVADHGFLQISSQTEYHRWEPMHFPEVENILPLTPRIEFENENGYFTNLYEFDGRLQVEEFAESGEFRVKTTGELSDHFFLPGGVAYCLEHRFTDNSIEKSVKLRYHDGGRSVRIVEPIFKYPGMTFERCDDRTIIIKGEKRIFHFEVLEGEVKLEAGKNELKYQAVFPAVKCYPIVLHVNRPDSTFKATVRYRIVVFDR